MTTVTRWVFNDPTAGASPATYTVPFNPNKMTSPYAAARAITVKTSTSVGGQPIFWEGQTPPTEWTFTGSILDQDHFDAFNTWREKKTITTITDHYGRTWTVYWIDFQAIPAPASRFPYKHDYTVKVLVLGGPA